MPPKAAQKPTTSPANTAGQTAPRRGPSVTIVVVEDARAFGHSWREA